ncbi:MAG: glycoside hydrolase family 130 protein [Clostridia bacterium]|nr:glycosidase [Clostridiales bacterium]MBQ6715522.1 glycoside hydrolase family 130 protein [Clostridia bacterium]
MAKIIGKALPNIPWENKPEGCKDVVWRYSANPIVQRDAIPCSNSIFNSAVVPFNGEFAGVFRCDDKRREMRIHSAHSKDGIHWDIDHEPFNLVNPIEGEVGPFIYGYDPRCCEIDGEHIVTWCNCYHGPTIGVATTKDFKTYTQKENAFLPFNRNGVMFPRKINGNYAMLSRPSDTGHTPFGDIFYSESPDLVYWGKHRHVMAPNGGWQSTKIGAGPIPIETDEGWLLFYHGVLTSCNGFVYSFGAALLDLEQPWKVLYRTEPYLLSPQKLYEQVGDVPNVAFPCAALADADTGRIAIYYGGADTVICMAFCEVNEVIDFIKKNSKV